ncbi:CLUMA_CG002766, isoform A [Clunio marinus]|uniref:CLUMA_CG002766, isoform A n=1 Tax=Clunio marinus TaxID=568069 RepID=A0A1J1HLE9_9DIPT|nr:CLUMA_CG002766, isoform A [Clunio marinus]
MITQLRTILVLNVLLSQVQDLQLATTVHAIYDNESKPEVATDFFNVLKNAMLHRDYNLTES